MPEIKDSIPFTLSNGTVGTAMILIIPLPDGRSLVACANKDEEEDAPVNMAIEDLFKTVVKKHKLDPAKVVWVEYTSYTVPVASGELGGWELVTWKGKPGTDPVWTTMTAAHWADLGTTPPPRFRQHPPDGSRF